jgi:hypothetical protein
MDHLPLLSPRRILQDDHVKLPGVDAMCRAIERSRAGSQRESRWRLVPSTQEIPIFRVEPFGVAGPRFPRVDLGGKS